MILILSRSEGTQQQINTKREGDARLSCIFWYLALKEEEKALRYIA